MTLEILGRREDQRLEFKSAETLTKEPSQIARAVVGMLNAGGGEVWIGVEEEDSVAVAVEPVHDPERAKQRLRDYLMDVLDPSPLEDEVSIELMPAGADPAVLVMNVQATESGKGRKLYAFRKAGGWHFLRRVGARNHPMSREEIFGRAAEREGDTAVQQAIRELEEARNRFRDSGEGGLWLGLQPARTINFDPEDDRFVEIALDPGLTGNRQAGRHFARSSSQPRPAKSRIEWEHWSEFWRRTVSRTEVYENGALRFWTALDRLRGNYTEDREIWPLTLLEYPISAFRIARVIYRGFLEPEDRVAADLALFGIDDWGLRGGTPEDDFLTNRPKRLEEPDLIWEPMVFSFREIEEEPDRCGFRLVRRVYQAFGWREEDMPRQYNTETGRLILPE